MIDNFYQKIYLLFLARQGYWSKENEVSKKNLFYLTYQYFLVSILLFFVLLFFHKPIKDLLETNSYKGWISYYELIIYVLDIIIFLGIIYENYFTLKTNTINSIYVFFRVPLTQVKILIFLRNIIIIMPALIFLTFYQGLSSILLFCLVHLLSLFFLPKFFNTKNKTKKIANIRYTMSKFSVNMLYVYSVLGISYILKAILTPVFSLIIFLLISFSTPNILEVTNSQSAFMLGILCGSIFFQSKHLSFGFLSLNNDFPFFKTIGISVIKYVVSIIVILNAIQLIFVVLIFWLINQIYFGWPNQYFVVIILGVCLAFSLINSVQMILASHLRSIGFKKANELEAYSIPLKLRVSKFIMNFYMTIIIIIGNYFVRYSPTILFFSVVIALFSIPIFFKNRKLSIYLGEI